MQNTSSLVDLKAELTRKEDEVRAGRTTRSSDKEKGCKTFAKINQLTGGRKKKAKRRIGKKRRKDEDEEEEESQSSSTSDETLKLLEEARRKLEAKSKIYDKMHKGEMEDLENIYGETKFLVDFQRKYYADVDEDVEEAKNMDACSRKSEEGNNSSFNDSTVKAEGQDAPNNSINNSALLFEINEAQREKMREKWEKEQDELLNGPVHYEHVKFDEVRNLGTGYFAFSKDEEERKKQLEDFNKLRDSTKNAHNKMDALKMKRKAALQERLNKVKKRKYGSDGCEEGGEPSCQDDGQLTTTLNGLPQTEQRESLTEGCSDEHQGDDLGEDDERTLNECRKDAHKERDWDKGKGKVKNGGNFVKEIFKKSSAGTLYEEMLKEKRSERLDEFAPPNFY